MARIGYIAAASRCWQAFAVGLCRRAAEIAAVLLYLTVTACSAAPANDSRYIAVEGNPWRLAVGDFNGDGQKELAFGAYEGAVRCIDPRSGKRLWQAALGGFPFGLLACDLNRDGRDDLLVAGADGRLYAFAGDGKLLWSYSANKAALYSVAALRRDKSQSPLVACGGMDRQLRVLMTDGTLLATHDFGKAINHVLAVDSDGDGNDEILVIGTRSGVFQLLRLHNGTLQSLWRKSLSELDTLNKIESFHPAMADAADIDGDRKTEILLGSTYHAQCRAALQNADLSPRWQSPPWRGPDTAGFERRNMFCMTLVRIADVIADSPGPEVVAVTTGNVRVFSREGKLLGEADAEVGFTDIAADGTTMYLGGTPNGDNTIYRINMSGDWPQAIRTLKRQGLPLQMGDTLKTIERQALALPDTADRTHRYRFDIGTVAEQNDWANRSGDWFGKKYAYTQFAIVSDSGLGGMNRGLAENVRLTHEGKPSGKNPDGKSPEEIARRTANLEKSGRELTFYFSHGCAPRMTVATLDKMMQAAPKTLRGFVTHEDEFHVKVPGYCTEFLAPLAERCAARGRTLTMYEKNAFWFDSPANPQVARSLFNGKGCAAIIAGTDDANSRTPELNLLSRVGLKQAGLVGHIAACPITDLNAFNRMQEWEYPKHGHLFFRLMVAHTVLGADTYHLRVDNFHGATLTAESEEAFAPFLHLLGRGVVFAPKPEQMAGLSPLGFAVHQPPEKWIADGHNGHNVDRWEADEELDAAVLPHNACFWGNTPTPPQALTAVLLHKKRQCGYFVPPTPYGPFVFVPAAVDLTKVVGVRDWWHTDGITVWREGGPRLSGQAAADALRTSFGAAAAQLPFRAKGDDVFFHSLKLGEGRYRLFAIDPGWIDPAERRITIEVQLAGDWRLTDTLTGQPVTVADRSAPLVVPAGALRILDAEPVR